MAKKQTRRSISVSRTTYERLKAFCEANSISMSQLVETRVNDFLGEGTGTVTVVPTTQQRMVTAPAPAPSPSLSGSPMRPMMQQQPSSLGQTKPMSETRPSSPTIPMTSAAARFAVDPPPPIIKQKQETAAPKPAEKRPDQIFTF